MSSHRSQCKGCSVVTTRTTCQYGSLMTAGQIAYDILTTCLPTALTPENYTSTIARGLALASGTINQIFDGHSSTARNFLKSSTVMPVEFIRKLCTAGRFDCSSPGPVFHGSQQRRRFDGIGCRIWCDPAVTGARDLLVKCGMSAFRASASATPRVNRTYVRKDGRRFGPIEDAAAVAAWGRYLSREVDGEWLNAVDNTGFAFKKRAVSAGSIAG